jgi:hypothetical protein
MPDQTINCPKCGAAFALDAALAAPMLKQVEQHHAEELAAANKRAEQIAASVGEAVAREHNATKAAALAESKAAIAEELQKAKQVADEAEAEMTKMRSALTYAQEAQVAAIKHERELSARERELALTIEKQVSAGIDTARQAARRDADEANRLKLLERDQLVEVMQKKVAELQQKIEQGSTQTQGEILELDVEAQLRGWFPRDDFAEVGKGIRGADITHRVLTPSGVQCGIIIYELKRTKTFSQGWLPKLRGDGREAHADVLVLVTQAMPDDVAQFGLVDGVWVCRAEILRPLVDALRVGLLGAQLVRQAAEGEATQSEIVYRYLTGPRFKARIEATVEAWTVMQSDLEAERRVVTRTWAKRAAQIDAVMSSTTGLFGDIQGLGGSAIPEIEGLTLKALGKGGE